jgi:ribosome maturation factor RimP
VDSIFKTPLEAAVLDLCEKLLGPEGFRAVDVDCRMASRSLVRIFIEPALDLDPERLAARPQVSATLGDCSRMSPILGTALEASGLLPGAYDLEVSSPGLDRRLRLSADFAGQVGSDIKLKLIQALPGRGTNLSGRLTGFFPEGEPKLVVEVDGKSVDVPLEKIKQANVVWRPVSEQ